MPAIEFDHKDWVEVEKEISILKECKSEFIVQHTNCFVKNSQYWVRW